MRNCSEMLGGVFGLDLICFSIILFFMAILLPIFVYYIIVYAKCIDRGMQELNRGI